MIIYNITTNIDESVHTQWLEWMQKEHIPAMIATGSFISARLVKVLIEEEMGGVTYSAQFFAPSMEALEKYHSDFSNQMNTEGMKRFADKMLTFHTELEIISEH